MINNLNIIFEVNFKFFVKYFILINLFVIFLKFSQTINKFKINFNISIKIKLNNKFKCNHL